MYVKKLKELAKQGAAIRTAASVDLVGVIGVVDGVLWYTPPFPQDQHHVHILPFDKAEIHHDRDIEFRQGEQLVAYVAPLGEWADIEVSGREEIAAWQAVETDYHHFIQEELQEQGIAWPRQPES